ncbi:hypothetical protein K443DRAFT_686394 [Laccaria amethystina LaAM-08-1]|uniref:Uncharacterized protein n=1 Tax=Laccaria amethystina LaAM-08-1 TaxID=1095629 RepID=A0A0C9WSD5_9AGAR|nr:hypothetical protein K443DRAFT_686394 [Laccaria amethystina LaAM-08-1]
MPSSPPSTYLYILLSYRAENHTTSYLWSLAPSPRKDGPHGPIDVYAIDNPGGTWTKNYTHHHDLSSSSSSPSSSQNSSSLLGCVRLPCIPAPQSDISAFITQYPAHCAPSAPRLPSESSLNPGAEPQWSCARWAIHIISDLVDAGLLPDDLARDSDAFYWRVHKLGVAMHAVPKRVGVLKVVDYA